MKALLADASLNDQDILAYFTRPGRTVNHARIAEIRDDKPRHRSVAAASPPRLTRFLVDWPHYDHVTGLHPVDDELLVKAREAMLNAVQGYNNPRALFRSECFIVLAIIAWTYLMHWHFRRLGIDYRSRKDDGTVLMTAHKAEKHWELETCLKPPECPLDMPTKENLRFLIGIRHEVEHQMTRRVDEALSAKLQACALNFNAALKALKGDRCGLDREMTFAIQLAGIEQDQRNMLLKDMGLPPNILAAVETFEQSLPEEVRNDQRYAWRVMMVRKNTNSKGAADEVVEFVKPGSDLEGEIQQVLIKDVEKPKFRPTEIVSRVKQAGFKGFTMYQHTLLMRKLKSRDPSKPFGTFVDQDRKDWRWYQSWLDKVLEHLRTENLVSASTDGIEAS